MVSYDIKFNPVQCTSETFKNLSATDGFLYFLTDTKQMYLAKNGQFVNMCGGVNIHYGTKKIEYENSGQAPDPHVTFQVDELENQENPLPGDLILNTDGCFYKVETVSQEGIATVRLTLQGTGTGSGGGGGTSSSSYSINVTPQNNIFSSEGEKMEIYFQSIASAQTENYISHIAFSIGSPVSESNQAFYELDGFYEIGTLETPIIYPIDLIQYKHLFGSSAVTVYLNTTDAYGTNLSKKFTVQIVDLSLKLTEDSIFKTIEDTPNYTCAVGGAKSGITNKKLIFSFYTENNLNEPLFVQEQDLDSSFTGTKQVRLNLTNRDHGVYIMEVRAQAQISGSSTTIYSNILTHKVIRFIPESANPLLAVVLPASGEQYTNIPMDYLLASTEENKNYTLNIKIDATEKPPLTITTNVLNTYTLYFEAKGTYTITVSIVELGGLEQTFVLDIKEYTGNLPIIDPANASLMLYLTPKGQSNNAVKNYEWPDYNGRYKGLLDGVYYSDTSGWLEDTDGTSYLQLTSGGKLTIPDFYPFAEDPTKDSETNSAMGQGMTIELDFEINGVTDYNAELIKCLSENQDHVIQVGFSITGNKIRFYSNFKNGGEKGSLVNMNLIEGKRIRLSFVIEPNDKDHSFPMCLTYLNGKISNAAIYSKDDQFIDSSAIPAQLLVNSENAQIKIYGIRFYTTALTDNEILNNFTASLTTLEERQERFNSNNVYNNDNLIDYEDVTAESYDLQIPYMTIIGGWACNPDDKWEMLPGDQVGAAALPTGKKDYRMIDVSVTYPKNEYFKNHKNYSYKNIFENGLGMTDNFGNKPINKTGCIMYAQGTSSMEYPVKNLRLRFRGKNDYFTVFPDISPVEIICMKADYMESSGSHNTGAANLIDDLYANASLKSPGQVHFGPTEEHPDRKEIVTCIKGHPCLIFWSPNGEKGTFQYIGKYNLNLDKATPEPFGFNHDDSDFGYLKPGDEYYAIEYDDDGDKFIGQEKPTDGGDYNDSKDGEELKVVQEGQKINSIHCFEFLDNAVPVCNFLKRPKAYIEDKDHNLIPDPSGGYYTYEETWYNEFDAGKGETAPGWTFGFESRYPEDRVGYHDADMLYPFASWLSELYYLKTQGSSDNGIPSQQDIELANGRFKNEYQAYLNKDFLLFYYIVTESLLMADSRVKNMMIATWGKEEEFSYYPLAYKEHIKYVYTGTVGTVNWDSEETYYKLVDKEYIIASQDDEEHTILYTQNLVYSWEPDTTQEKEITHFYKWYPIFYDMDTMLGLDNTGVNRFSYYDEDDDPSIYNGDEVLWNFVRDCLASELDQMYNKLEPAGLNIDLDEQGNYKGTSLIPYFNNNQANMANEAFYNGDAQYKYIRPAISGYWDGLNNEPVPAGEAPYLYAAQGDRSLDREYFITNRTKFLRGKHGSEDFQTSDRITFRLYYPTGQEANFKETIVDAEGNTTIIDHSSSVNPNVVPPSDTFDFESLQTCYAGVLIGANGHVVKERFEGEQRKSIKVQEAQSANGTEAYLLGVSGLKDLGDLSNKYPQKFIMSGKNKLQTLTFGNPHKEYYNPFWRPAEGNSTPIGLSGCTYLQTFNMQNCKTYNAEIDFTNCPVIETILLTGSSTSNIKLPVNGMIKELRLPTSISKLSIDSHQYLTKNKFSIGTYQYGSDNLIGGNGQYVNDYTYLTDLTIIDTPIDSYEMVSNASNLEGYYFKGFTWDITGSENDNQYIKTTDLEMNSEKTYYIWNSSEKKYVIATQTDFEEKRNLIKEKVLLINHGAITQIPILEYLKEKSPRKNSTSVTRASALSGTIVIKARANVNQFNLYQKYNEIYPNVTIEYDEEAIGSGNLTKAYKIEFFNTPNVTDDMEPYHTVLTDGNYTFKELISIDGPAKVELPTPSMQSTPDTVYVFTGKWKVVGSNKIYDINNNEDLAIKIEENLKLEPIYTPTERKYTVKFYNHEANLHKEVQYTYSQIMSKNKDTPMYLGRDDSELEEFERYTFKGWINEKDFRNQVENPTIINLETKQVTYDMFLYPYYVVEDARKVPSSLDFFNIKSETVRYSKTIYNNETGEALRNEFIELGTHYVLELKESYRKSISGKITLPSRDKDGNYITVVGTIAGTDKSNITHIFFLENHKYESIGTPQFNNGFYNLKELTTVYFPNNTNTLRYIGYNAFFLTTKLTNIYNLPDSIEYISTGAFKNSSAPIATLPANLTYIGSEAFEGATGLTVSNIPLGVTQIPNNAFAKCTNLQITTFGRDTQSDVMSALDNNIEFIATNAFAKAGKKVDSLYFNNSIQYLGNLSFDNYGNDDRITVYDNTGKITTATQAVIFGTASRDIVLVEEGV